MKIIQNLLTVLILSMVSVTHTSGQVPPKVKSPPKLPLSNLKFDIDLELDHMVVRNVRDLDGREDLYGIIYCMKATALTKYKQNKNDMIFFNISRSQANTNNFRNGSYQIDKRILLFKDMTLDQLRNVELSVGGSLNDREFQLDARFICQDCQITLQFDSSQLFDYFDKFRTVKFAEMSSTLASINSLVNNGLYQTLKFGGDNFFELNYYEWGDKNDGWVKLMWKVWVKPHH